MRSSKTRTSRTRASRTLWRLILRRLAAFLPSLAGVVVVTFILTRVLPGDPAAYLAGNTTSFEAIEQIRHDMRLDRPLWQQFVFYVEDLAQGKLGRSMTSGQPVLEELLARLPASLELTVTGLAVSMLIGIPLGVLSATRVDSWLDHLTRVVATTGVSLPTFFTGLLLIYLFYYLLGWAPSPLGRLDPYLSPPTEITHFLLFDSLLGGDLEVIRSVAAQLALPIATLAIYTVPPIMRMTRASMLGVLSSDFIRTSRAHGLPRMIVLGTYAFRNALLPIITTLGMVFSFTLGASVLIEKVFAWPGVGLYALESLIALDYAPVQGFVLAMAVLYLTLNLVVDILYALVDPRVRIAR